MKETVQITSESAKSEMFVLIKNAHQHWIFWRMFLIKMIFVLKRIQIWSFAMKWTWTVALDWSSKYLTKILFSFLIKLFKFRKQFLFVMFEFWQNKQGIFDVLLPSLIYSSQWKFVLSPWVELGVYLLWETSMNFVVKRWNTVVWYGRCS